MMVLKIESAIHKEKLFNFYTLEIKADFYRRQVILENHFGMMLQRSFF
ncbi:hypothetical protein SAMN05421755_104826 [Nitrosomonas sp. Nm33]|nr:hypothetical protein SAMN05421755_104826 [Nitrosomonas sp. Nm33]